MKKSISLCLAIAAVANMVLLGTGRIRPLLFWIIMAVIALFAYVVLPFLKK